MDLEMIKLKAIITIAFKAIGYVCSIYTNFYVFSGNLKRLRRHAVKLFSMKLNTPTFISILPYVLFAILLAGVSGCDLDDDIDPIQENISVGAILSLEGQWSTLGKNSSAALEIARDEINQYFEKIGYQGRIDIKIYDSELDPDKAAQHLESAVAEGFDVIIGPQSSAELSALKPLADQNNVLVISNGSTAGSLSLAGDNVFRFCPDGTLEGQALARQIYEDGVRGLVTVSRDDVGNRGLEIDLIHAFEALGGTIYSLDPYGVDTEDFGEVISGIENRLNLAISEFGQEGIAVYVAAFDEGVQLFEQASGNQALTSIRWYGGDGLVSSEALVNSSSGSEFAIATRFIAPNFALPENARASWEPLSNEIESRTGLSVSAFALAAYDALWVTALTLESERSPTRDFSKFKSLFVEKAKIHFGATGPTQLNQNGDRSIAAFGFWGIKKIGNSYQWELVATSE